MSICLPLSLVVLYYPHFEVGKEVGKGGPNDPKTD